MKKWFIKYKIMINGFSVKEKYEDDGFVLKTGKFDKERISDKYDESLNGVDIDIYRLLFESCSCNYKNLTYKYLESNCLKEIEVSNKINKSNYYVLIEKNQDIIENVRDYQKKMRIRFNVPVLFQCVNVEFYDENKKYVGCYQVIFSLSVWNRLIYKIDSKEFSNNSRFNFNINSMKSLNNNYFKRAIELFDDSFESEKITNRFLLIFSSLEAIFNLDTEKVSEKLARYTAKLLSEDNKIEYALIHYNMKKLYKKRSDFIHGSKISNIKDEDEKLLRKYARRVIIIYWLISQRTKMTGNQILSYLDSEEKMSPEIRMYISATVSESFSEQQHKLVKLVEEDIGHPLPPKIKQNILKNSDEKEYNYY